MFAWHHGIRGGTYGGATLGRYVLARLVYVWYWYVWHVWSIWCVVRTVCMVCLVCIVRMGCVICLYNGLSTKHIT